MPASGKASAKPHHNTTPGQSELLGPEDLPGLLNRPFDRLEVEIGCGNGHFMTEYCAENPDSLFIGVEIKKKRCLKAQRKIDKLQLANARIIHGEAQSVLQQLSDGSVDCFHLYFPDPWPKSRHRRRRFLRGGNIETLLLKLKTGGFIRFVTDYFDYYIHTKVLFLLAEGTELSGQPLNSSVYRSMFARRFAERGKPVRTLTVKKTSPTEKKTSPTERRSTNDEEPDQKKHREIQGKG
jgi:tRNA (guanine-N7-)-methyltransferase